MPKFQGARIPTLAEVLDLTKGKALLQIEIKQAEIEEQVAAVVRDADAIADCEVHSFWPQVVQRDARGRAADGGGAAHGRAAGRRLAGVLRVRAVARTRRA